MASINGVPVAPSGGNIGAVLAVDSPHGHPFRPARFGSVACEDLPIDARLAVESGRVVHLHFAVDPESHVYAESLLGYEPGLGSNWRDASWYRSRVTGLMNSFGRDERWREVHIRMYDAVIEPETAATLRPDVI